MASQKLFARFGISSAMTIFAMIPMAVAQVLPDIGGQVSGILDDLDRRVEDTVDGDIEHDAEALAERLGESVLADNAGRILGSAEIGNTLEETLSLSEELGLDLSGVVKWPDALGTGQAIDLGMADGWPVVRNEWILLVPAGRASEVEALDVDIVERTELAASRQTLFTVSLTATNATAQAIEAELDRLGGEPFDRNHVYRGAAGPQPAEAGVVQSNAGRPVPPREAGSVRIGLIDTDIDEAHPAFAGIEMFESDFVSLGDLRPQGHGTATASILAAHRADGRQRQLLAASTFFLSNDGTTGATSASLVSAIDWLVSNEASVVNVSLTGPPNKALEAVIRAHQEQGVVFVAAVGNEGPASGPLFPAAYDGVIGVTAVDANGQVYRWANRGPFVDVAALGVNVPIAKPGRSVGRDSGTSFAAPVVSAFLAGWTGAAPLSRAAPDEVIRASVTGGKAAPQRDETYGYGILKTKS